MYLIKRAWNSSKSGVNNTSDKIYLELFPQALVCDSNFRALINKFLINEDTKKQKERY